MLHFRAHSPGEVDPELIELEARHPFPPVFAAIVTNKNLRAGFRREPQYLVNWLQSRFNGAYSRTQIVRTLKKLEDLGILESETDMRGRRFVRLSPRFRKQKED